MNDTEKNELRQLEELIQAKSEKNKDFFSALLKNFKTVSERLEDLNKSISVINQNIIVLYNEIESIKKRDYVPHRLMSIVVADLICNKHNHECDKEILVKNLDEDSLQIIMSVLNKYEYMANGGIINDFMNDTVFMAALKKVQSDFLPQIKQLNSHCYEFQGYKLPKNEFSTSVFLDEHGLFKINKNLISENDVILDVGGYIADSVLLFRKHFPKNRIYSFEAVQANFEFAKITIGLNKLENVIMENLALGDEKGELYINEFKASGCFTSKHKESMNAEICRTTTLNDYVKENNIIGKIGLIKVDIEGSEQNFLRGALDIIKRDRPVMLISIYHNYNDLMYIKPFIESLELNYTFKIHKPADKLFGEILLICEPN